METHWQRINVCAKCSSLKHNGVFCKKCGNMGGSIVLRRYKITFFKIEKEYKNYDHMVNPFEK
jgi:ribosomal protein L32